MKTKEDILKHHLRHIQFEQSDLTFANVCAAMEEYASQQLSALQQENQTFLEFQKCSFLQEAPTTATTHTVCQPAPVVDKPDHEHEFYLDEESRPYFCECGVVEIGGKEYYPEEHVPELRQQPTEWIPVSERLPENKNDVLCFEPNNHIFVGNYTKGHEIEYSDEDYDGEYDPIEEKNGTLYLKSGWYECEEQVQSAYDEYWIKRDVTHWKPIPSLPEPPKQ